MNNQVAIQVKRNNLLQKIFFISFPKLCLHLGLEKKAMSLDRKTFFWRRTAPPRMYGIPKINLKHAFCSSSWSFFPTTDLTQEDIMLAFL